MALLLCVKRERHPKRVSLFSISICNDTKGSDPFVSLINVLQQFKRVFPCMLNGAYFHVLIDGVGIIDVGTEGKDLHGWVTYGEVGGLFIILLGCNVWQASSSHRIVRHSL